MKHYSDIIKASVITEKSMGARSENVYTFKCDKRATKPQIKKAVEAIFGVNVEKVNTLNYDGKVKRMGRSVGRTASFKKAVVKLTADSKEIEFFQGM